MATIYAMCNEMNLPHPKTVMMTIFHFKEKLMDKLKMQTPNLADENFTALAALFPNAVTEMVDENGAIVRTIDKNVLAQEINANVVEDREERYRFTWPDKRKSILLATALRPCREESVDFDATENLYIEGDNLNVLKLLRETYLNRVKMIYVAHYGNYLIACFKRLDTALITEIAKQKTHYAMFRNSSFTSDSAMVNFEQVLNAYSPNTIRRAL
jgi:adenine-specific DNA-methyltransferase